MTSEKRLEYSLQGKEGKVVKFIFRGDNRVIVFPQNKTFVIFSQQIEIFSSMLRDFIRHDYVLSFKLNCLEVNRNNQGASFSLNGEKILVGLAELEKLSAQLIKFLSPWKVCTNFQLQKEIGPFPQSSVFWVREGDNPRDYEILLSGRSEESSVSISWSVRNDVLDSWQMGCDSGLKQEFFEALPELIGSILSLVSPELGFPQSLGEILEKFKADN